MRQQKKTMTMMKKDDKRAQQKKTMTTMKEDDEGRRQQQTKMTTKTVAKEEDNKKPYSQYNDKRTKEDDGDNEERQ